MRQTLDQKYFPIFNIRKVAGGTLERDRSGDIEALGILPSPLCSLTIAKVAPAIEEDDIKPGLPIAVGGNKTREGLVKKNDMGLSPPRWYYQLFLPAIWSCQAKLEMM